MLVFLIFFIKNGPTINHDITLHLHAQLKSKEEQKNVAFFMLDLVNPRGNITNTTLYICMLLLLLLPVGRVLYHASTISGGRNL